jgi:soluble lytic murein transglycosylase-like protein
MPSRNEVFVPLWMRSGNGSETNPFRSLPTPSLASDCRSSFTQVIRTISGLSAIARARRREHYEHLQQAACEAGVPFALFDALVAQESRYDVRARSSAGAIGLAQLMPATARYLGVANPWDPLQNLRAGARYLRWQYNRFGSWALALAAYNAGPGNVEKYRGIPPFRETREYVRVILAEVDRGHDEGRLVAVPRSPGRFAEVRRAEYAPGSDIPEN